MSDKDAFALDMETKLEMKDSATDRDTLCIISKESLDPQMEQKSPNSGNPIPGIRVSGSTNLNLSNPYDKSSEETNSSRTSFDPTDGAHLDATFSNVASFLSEAHGEEWGDMEGDTSGTIVVDGVEISCKDVPRNPTVGSIKDIIRNMAARKGQPSSCQTVPNIARASIPGMIYTCEFCPSRFKYLKNFQRHLRAKHIPYCVPCQERFPDFKDLWRHQQDQHKDDDNSRILVHACKTCVAIFPSSNDLEVHVEYAHSGSLKVSKPKQLQDVLEQFYDKATYPKKGRKGNGSGTLKYNLAEYFYALPSNSETLPEESSGKNKLIAESGGKWFMNNYTSLDQFCSPSADSEPTKEEGVASPDSEDQPQSEEISFAAIEKEFEEESRSEFSQVVKTEPMDEEDFQMHLNIKQEINDDDHNFGEWNHTTPFYNVNSPLSMNLDVPSSSKRKQEEIPGRPRKRQRRKELVQSVGDGAYKEVVEKGGGVIRQCFVCGKIFGDGRKLYVHISCQHEVVWEVLSRKHRNYLDGDSETKSLVDIAKEVYTEAENLKNMSAAAADLAEASKHTYLPDSLQQETADFLGEIVSPENTDGKDTVTCPYCSVIVLREGFASHCAAYHLRCTACRMIFANKAKLEEHKQNEHLKEKRKCPKCRRIFRGGREKLKFHLVITHQMSMEEYEELVKQKPHSTTTTLPKPQLEETETPIPTPTSKSTADRTESPSEGEEGTGRKGRGRGGKDHFTMNGTLIRSSKRAMQFYDPESQSHLCPECKSPFSTSNGVLNHVKIVHSDHRRSKTIFLCKLCNAKFESMGRYRQHLMHDHKKGETFENESGTSHDQSTLE